MAVGCVDDDGVDTCLHQCLCTVERVVGDTHAGSHAQTSFVVLASHRLVLGLGDVFISDQSHEMVGIVDHGEFLDLVLLKNLSSRCQIGALMGGDQVLGCHHVVDELVHVTLETEVAVGDDAHEVVFLIDDRNAANVIVVHHVKGILDGASAANGDRVVDHTVLSTLDNGHLTSLFLDRHILMDHTDTTLACNGNGHRRLGHRVHSGGDKGDIEFDVARKTSFQRHFLRKHFRISRNQQDIIKCESVHHNFICNK